MFVPRIVPRIVPGIVPISIPNQHPNQRPESSPQSVAQPSTTLQVSVYDAQHVGAVAAAIESSGLQLSPEVMGKSIKLQIPRPSTEFRSALVKKLKALAEASKKGVRAHRQKAMQQCKKLGSQDEIKKAEKQVQALTDKYTKMADQAFEVKEKDVVQL